MKRTRKVLVGVGAGVLLFSAWPADAAPADEPADDPLAGWYEETTQGSSVALLDSPNYVASASVGGYLSCPQTKVSFWQLSTLKNVFGNNMLYKRTDVSYFTDCGVTWGAGNPWVTAWVSDSAKLAGWKFDRVANYWVKNFKDRGQPTGGLEWYDYSVFLYRSNPGGLYESDWQPWTHIKARAYGALYDYDSVPTLEYRTHHNPNVWHSWNG